MTPVRPGQLWRIACNDGFTRTLEVVQINDAMGTAQAIATGGTGRVYYVAVARMRRGRGCTLIREADGRELTASSKKTARPRTRPEERPASASRKVKAPRGLTTEERSEWWRENVG